MIWFPFDCLCTCLGLGVESYCLFGFVCSSNCGLFCRMFVFSFDLLCIWARVGSLLVGFVLLNLYCYCFCGFNSNVFIPLCVFIYCYRVCVFNDLILVGWLGLLGYRFSS